MLKRLIAPTAALLAAGLVGGLAAVAAWEAVDDDPAAAPAAAAAAATTSPPAEPVAETGRSIADVVEGAMPGVVEVTAGGGARPPGGDGPEPFRPRVPGSTGSGWLIDDAGHVVTNQHVVGTADEVEVTFHDGTEARAEVLGADPSTDVAVVKVDELPDGVEPIAFGSTGSLRIGETVIAIGSPFGLQGTVTAGIVSALDRDITAPDGFTIDGAVQTDAALNHGNSGGPLLDTAGRAVGMNAQIASETGGNDGVGYAIPAETVRSIAEQLIAEGRVRHAYLGVRIGDAADGGAEVSEVVSGGPADDAGLEQGDVVVAVDGDEVESADELREAVAAKRPGDELSLEVRRGEATETLTVELGTRPSSAD